MGYLKNKIYNDEDFMMLLKKSVQQLDSCPDSLMDWFRHNMNNENVTVEMAEGGLIEAISVTLSIEDEFLQLMIDPLMSWHVCGWVIMLGLRLKLIEIELPPKEEEKNG